MILWRRHCSFLETAVCFFRFRQSLSFPSVRCVVQMGTMDITQRAPMLASVERDSTNGCRYTTCVFFFAKKNCTNHNELNGQSDQSGRREERYYPNNWNLRQTTKMTAIDRDEKKRSQI